MRVAKWFWGQHGSRLGRLDRAAHSQPFGFFAVLTYQVRHAMNQADLQVQLA